MILPASAFPLMPQAQSVATDPNTLLLLKFNGTNGSTTFTDSSQYARTVTGFNGAAISTAQSKFDGASGFFDGANDACQVSISFGDLYTSGKTATVEFFVYLLTRDAVVDFFLSNWVSGAGWEIRAETSGVLGLSQGSGLSSFGGPAVSLNTWNHIAVVNTGSSIIAYLNGAALPNTLSNHPGTTSSNLWICGRPANSIYTNAYIDELRISDVVRYTGNFTPPTSPFNP